MTERRRLLRTVLDRLSQHNVHHRDKDERSISRRIRIPADIRRVQDVLLRAGRNAVFKDIKRDFELNRFFVISDELAADVLREVGKECGATSFSAWCQTACAWYLHQTPNQAVKDKYLADILQGKVLAGTGMSNTVKHLAGIEKHNLQAERVDGGYKVNGALPWVSNIGEDHIWANTAQIGDGYVMFITGGQWEGVTLQACPEFCALEGTRTFSLNFKDVFIPDEDVIAAPEQFSDYIASIKSGFILLQIGIGAGVSDGSLGIIRIANVVNAEVNSYLDDGYDSLKAALDEAWQTTEQLADLAWNNTPDNLATLKLRAAAAELTLAAAQSAALHAGAKGYLMRSPAQRRVREAMFVAIVTPALKHLRKEIAALEVA